MMKNKFNILLLALFVMLVTACEEDEGSFTGPYRIVIAGPHGADPGEVAEFTIGNVNDPGSYTWSVEGPARIVGNASGNTVDVEFTGVGDVTLTVSRGEDTGLTRVSVNEVEPSVAATLQGTGVLRSGQTGTVTFDFATPIVGTPAFDMFSEGFQSGNLSNLQKVDDDTYTATFTAGEGNGTPQALFQDITATEMFGGINIDSAIVDLFQVDNTAPVADLSFSQSRVREGSKVTVTAAFSEDVIPQGTDENIMINFSRPGAAVETGILQPTNDPRVFTFDYTVTANEPATNIEASLPNAVDFAGSPLAAVNNADELQVDNVNPTILTANAVDIGAAVKISMSSSEDGTGWFIVLPDGADAPTSTEDFGGGVINNSWNLSGGTMRSTSVSLSQGNYDVYFIVSDEAGNMSPVEMVNLSVD